MNDQSLSKLNKISFNFTDIKDFNKIYSENDIELLRYYLTLYHKRLIAHIKD